MKTITSPALGIRPLFSVVEIEGQLWRVISQPSATTVVVELLGLWEERLLRLTLWLLRK